MKWLAELVVWVGGKVTVTVVKSWYQLRAKFKEVLPLVIIGVGMVTQYVVDHPSSLGGYEEIFTDILGWILSLGGFTLLFGIIAIWFWSPTDQRPNQQESLVFLTECFKVLALRGTALLVGGMLLKLLIKLLVGVPVSAQNFAWLMGRKSVGADKKVEVPYVDSGSADKTADFFSQFDVGLDFISWLMTTFLMFSPFPTLDSVMGPICGAYFGFWIGVGIACVVRNVVPLRRKKKDESSGQKQDEQNDEVSDADDFMNNFLDAAEKSEDCWVIIGLSFFMVGSMVCAIVSNWVSKS